MFDLDSPLQLPFNRGTDARNSLWWTERKNLPFFFFCSYGKSISFLSQDKSLINVKLEKYVDSQKKMQWKIFE